MKKVLIALDYDPTAQKVAESGFTLAKAMGAKVVLVHVVSDPVYYSSNLYSPIMGFGGFMNIDFMQLDVVTELKNSSQDFLNKTKQYLGDESIQTLVEEGDFADSILEAAKDVRADIIVIGSHSRRWLDEILIGSVAEEILRHSSIPLYIIPTKKHK
jgi:nucleotide-binding universal stress UspA family protein